MAKISLAKVSSERNGGLVTEMDWIVVSFFSLLVTAVNLTGYV